MTDGVRCPHCSSTAVIRIRQDQVYCLACLTINGQPYVKP